MAYIVVHHRWFCSCASGTELALLHRERAS
ncbi:hypothetical protein EYZ11_006317 [Aspergillus tanneri]|uniref:Uncharacterized protein n=1 Tax=Aspergillus tanneri TaxID=1220188 RepID=A0A4S3JI93_9EURO|nr:hypothetical protein EYZ11_006317 [Aspergillus tanneri]